MEEKTFFENGNVKVTSSRFIVGAQTFAMSSVNSVKVAVKNVTPSGGIFVVFGVVGILISLFSIAALMNGELGSLAVLIPAGALSALSLRKYIKIKAIYEYSIVLTTSSGEAAALNSRDMGYIDKIEKALVECIVSRG